MGAHKSALKRATAAWSAEDFDVPGIAYNSRLMVTRENPALTAQDFDALNAENFEAFSNQLVESHRDEVNVHRRFWNDWEKEWD